MYPVSKRFAEVTAGSHRAVVRVQVLPAGHPQFGPSPTGGTMLEVLGGDVKLSSSADVKGTIELTVPGRHWEALLPYGVEVFAERGIDFGDGVPEYVPLGYFGVDECHLDRIPDGSIRVSGSDRTARLMRNRVVYPYQVPAGMTHRQLFNQLVNGDPAGLDPSAEQYGMFLFDLVPITWTSYDPDQAKLPAGQVVEDDAYGFLAKLVAGRGCVLRFARTGELVVGPVDQGEDAAPAAVIRDGEGGTLIKASQSISNRGLYNMVVARGSDPAAPTGYRLAYNTDPFSPLIWTGPFGVVPRYYASPLLRTSGQADAAAEKILAKYKAAPLKTSVLTVPNPAYDPVDVVEVVARGVDAVYVIDEVTIPLTEAVPVTITTRTLNELPTDEEGDTTGGGVPANPGTGSGGTGGGGGTTVPGQTLGVGGVATPAGAVLATADTTNPLTITTGGTADSPKVYDGQGKKVGRVTIKAKYVTVQNYYITAGGQYGAVLDADYAVLQNCDIKGVKASGDGDLNAVTLWGANCKIRYNTMVDFVSGDPGGSHTDGIQTWVSSSHPVAPINTEVVGNKITGPANPSRNNSIPSIHQCIMIESGGNGGNSGGSSAALTGWVISDNEFGDSWNQSIKMNNLVGPIVTRNRFVGSSDKVIDPQGSTGIKFYADNQIGSGYGSVGVGITAGNGPGGATGGTPGGTGGTGTLADRWQIGFGDGLSKINLGIDFLPADGPEGSKGKHVDFDLTKLTAPGGFTWPGYVDLRPDGAVRLTAYVGAATTPNSTHSRTESRGLAQDGKAKQSVNAASGEHYVFADFTVVRGPAGRPDICLLQWHTPDDDLCMIRWQNGTVISTFGDKGRPGTLATGVTVGSRHKAMIRLTPTQIRYYLDDMATPKATQSWTGSSGLYAKTGNYQQSSTAAPYNDPVGEMAVVDLYRIGYWSSGDPEPKVKP